MLKVCNRWLTHDIEGCIDVRRNAETEEKYCATFVQLSD